MSTPPGATAKTVTVLLVSFAAPSNPPSELKAIENGQQPV
jgi:hypothetical protein